MCADTNTDLNDLETLVHEADPNPFLVLSWSVPVRSRPVGNGSGKAKPKGRTRTRVGTVCAALSPCASRVCAPDVFLLYEVASWLRDMPPRGRTTQQLLAALAAEGTRPNYDHYKQDNDNGRWRAAAAAWVESWGGRDPLRQDQGQPGRPGGGRKRISTPCSSRRPLCFPAPPPWPPLGPLGRISTPSPPPPPPFVFCFLVLL